MFSPLLQHLHSVIQTTLKQFHTPLKLSKCLEKNLILLKMLHLLHKRFEVLTFFFQIFQKQTFVSNKDKTFSHATKYHKL